MLKNILWGLGWFLVVASLFSIAIKLLGTDELVLMHAGSSRNLDTPITMFATGLVFLALVSIMEKLDQILQRNEKQQD